jgi:hypothetical protein
MGLASGYASANCDAKLIREFDESLPLGKWYRDSVPWIYCQDTLNAQFNWQFVDRWVNLAHNANKEIIATLCYPPEWAWPDTLQDTTTVRIFNTYVRQKDWMFPAPGREFLQEWKNFCATAAQHLHDRFGVRYFEIMNEPNGQHFFMTKFGDYDMNIILYPELLMSASDTIRTAVGDSAFILLGSIWPITGDFSTRDSVHVVEHGQDYYVHINEEYISGLNWLSEIYSFDPNIKSRYNAVGYYPYADIFDADTTIKDQDYDVGRRGGPLYSAENYTNKFQYTSDVWNLMCINGDTTTTYLNSPMRKQIWGTEYGLNLADWSYTYCRESDPNCYNPIDVGRMTGDRVNVAAAWIDDYLKSWNSWYFTGPLLWYSPRDYLNQRIINGQRTCFMDTSHVSVTGSPANVEFYGTMDFEFRKRPAFYELMKWSRGYVSGEFRISSALDLIRWAPDFHDATIVLLNDIVLNEPARFGNGHRVVIKSENSSSPRTITGCLALGNCSLTLENVNIEQPADYASRDSSFVGFSNICLNEQSRLFIKGKNSRIHVDAQFAGTADSLVIMNADLSNSHDVAFLRVDGGDITLENCAMNGAENFGDLSTFRFANSDVTFKNFVCVGGISDSSTVELLNSNAVFEDSRIQSNSSLYGVGGVYFKSLGDHVLTLRGLELRDNETVDQTRPSNAYVRGGDIDLSDSRGALFICESIGCTSNAPQVMIDVAGRPDRTFYSIQNCLFRGGSVYINSIDNGLLPEVCAIRNVIIDNCHVTANRAGGTLEHVTVTGTGQISSDTVVRFTAWRSIFSGDATGIVFPANGHNWTPAMGDPKLSACGEPKWDSPCLDLLDDELEFDLTVGDLGAKAYRVVRNITTSVSDTLPLGDYTIAGNQNAFYIRGHITPGSIIKVGSGKTLYFWPQTNNLTTQIGDLNGPRTTIVGRPDRGAAPAKIIGFDNRFSDDLAQLKLEGVLFNYSPRYIDDHGMECANLGFKGWNPTWCGGPQIDGATVKFKYYTNAPLSENSFYDGGLVFDHCSGVIKNFDFGQSNGPAWLQLKDNRANVEHNTFIPQGGNPCLNALGVLTGETPSVTENTFRATVENPQTVPMLDAHGGLMDLRRNQFLDCQTTPIKLYSSSIHADLEARNNIRVANDFTNLQPLIGMQGGYLNLYCGRNNFVVRGYNALWPVISWIPDTSHTQALMTWRENFWGVSCQSGISETELNNRTLALIPPWATVEDNLSECVEVTTPANPLCPFETSTPMELLANGKRAEILGNFSLAQDNYRALLWLWAAKKESNEGTLRLKALGLHKEHGPGAYELVRDDLFVAADSSHVYKLGYQDALQRCSAWCVEARWGDRPLAIQSLNAMLTLAVDQVIRDIIKLALLEIATYPPLGGLQAMDDDAMFALAQAQQAATVALMNYQSGQDVLVTGAEVAPKAFEIARVYPNPFNATVTLELAFPSDGKARVSVYNLLGQVVQTVLDKQVTAGVQKHTLDATRWSSGLYFVVAEHEGAMQIRKMTLLK